MSTNQLTDDQSAEENDDGGSKVFTVNDIQTLMDNQLLHKSQLDQNLENNKLEQQHLILVTQNGDKIILIQNPSVADNQSVQLNTAPAIQPPTTTVRRPEENTNVTNLNRTESINDKQLVPLSTASVDNEPMADNETNDEAEDKVEELTRIQLQHRTRQQSLMLQLERLKEKHNKNSRTDDDEPNASTTEEDNFWEFDETNEYEKQKSSHKSSKQNAKKKSIPIEKFYCEAKWYISTCNNLEKAHNYVRRRSENVEQLSKYFPTASYAFESRCAELRKHLKKLELNLERFQNVLGKDLHFVENKLKNFFQDYHLEQFQAEIEEEDMKDLDPCCSENHHLYSNHLGSNCSSFTNQCDTHLHQPVISNCKNSTNSFSKLFTSSKMELITPSSISITPTNEYSDEIEPVPEIRDVNCDVSLEEMGKWYYSNNSTLNKSYPPSVSINIKTKKTYNRKSSNRDNDTDSKATKHQKRS